LKVIMKYAKKTRQEHRRIYPVPVLPKATKPKVDETPDESAPARREGEK
jgi:hypothetical protein